ncbi:hypothetical protein GCM10011428_57660 [Streptomyces violaceus]
MVGEVLPEACRAAGAAHDHRGRITQSPCGRKEFERRSVDMFPVVVDEDEDIGHGRLLHGRAVQTSLWAMR